MRQLRWINGSLFLALILSISATAQVSWRHVPLRFERAVRGFYVDSTDSTLYITGEFDTTNGAYSGLVIKVRKDFTMAPLPSLPAGSAMALTKWNGKLYLGAFGGPWVYDGHSWKALDTTFGGEAICFLPYKGKLLIGGQFEFGFNGDTSLKCSIIEYDGTTFRKFKGVDTAIDPSYFVVTMTEYNGELIVGGNIETYPPYDPRFHEILRWTGTKWDAVGNGIQGGGLNEVADLKVMNGKLYVGGYFTKASGGPGNGIASWDGTNWDDLGGGFKNGGQVEGLVSRGDKLYAIGSTHNIAGHYAEHIGAYSNGRWCVNQGPMGDCILLAGVDFFGKLLVGGGIKTIGNDSSYGNIAEVAGLGAFCPARRSGNCTCCECSEDYCLSESYWEMVTLEFYAQRSGMFSIQVMDIYGRRYPDVMVKAAVGQNKYNLGLGDFASSTYFIRLSNADNGRSESVKVSRQ